MSLMLRLNSLLREVTIGAERDPAEAKILSNKINALGGFMGGIKVPRVFTIRVERGRETAS